MPIKYRYGEMTWPEVKRPRHAGASRSCRSRRSKIMAAICRSIPTCCSARASASSPHRAPAIEWCSFRRLITATVRTTWTSRARLRSVAHTLDRIRRRRLQEPRASRLQKILIVNGHGSNAPFVDIIARLCVVADRRPGRGRQLLGRAGRARQSPNPCANPIDRRNESCVRVRDVALSRAASRTRRHVASRARTLAPSVEELLGRS